MLHIITEDFFEDIAPDVEKRFDTSNYDENDKRPLSIGKNKKGPGLFKDKVGGNNIEELCALRSKAYSYGMDDASEKKEAKGTKRCIIRFELVFDDCKYCLFSATVILRSQQRFKIDLHEMYTEEVYKIALSSDDDMRLQTINKIETYPYRTPWYIVCESEMLMVCEAKEKLKMLEEKLKMQSNGCESEMFVEEKDKCEMFLKMWTRDAK